MIYYKFQIDGCQKKTQKVNDSSLSQSCTQRCASQSAYLPRYRRDGTVLGGHERRRTSIMLNLVRIALADAQPERQTSSQHWHPHRNHVQPHERGQCARRTIAVRTSAARTSSSEPSTSLPKPPQGRCVHLSLHNCSRGTTRHRPNKIGRYQHHIDQCDRQRRYQSIQQHRSIASQYR